MLHEQLTWFTNEQLNKYTNEQLSQFPHLGCIYDRKYQDVQRWRCLRDKGWDNMTDIEQSEWLGEISPIPSATKGMYTHNDLNRVESTVESIATLFRSIGYNVPEMVTKTNWTYTDTITLAEMDRYFKNIETLRKILAVFGDTPKTPDVSENFFNYSRANDVERILSDVLFAINNTVDTWHYAGEVNIGEV